jgi:DNA-binding beta-propeller fold protein YncE
LMGSIYTGSWGSYDTPLRSAMSSDGARLYVPVPDTHVGSLAVVDTATATIADTITFLPELEDPEPIAVALSPDNRRAYVLLQAANGLLPVLDTGNRTVADVFEIGSDADSIAVSSDGSKLYLARATAAGEELNVIDVQTKGVSQIPLGMVSRGILAVVPGTGVAYVAASALAFAVDTRGLAVVAQVPVGGNSRDIAVGRINGPCRPAAYTPEPTSTPTPTVTVTPTKVPTFLQIGSASVPAGGDGTITVRLTTAGQHIAGIQNDISFGSDLRVHDCSSNLPFVGGFHDFGSSLRAEFFSPVGQPLFSDGGSLYSCQVTVASDTPPGRYPLLAVNIIGSDGLGNRITVAGADGEVTVTGPDAGAPSNTDPGTASSTSGGCRITGGSAADSLWLGLLIPILLLRRQGRAAEFRRLA